ncbi:hypothetical protein IGI37_003063 [Enterococcus sp. AZ194]|uniref:WxL domain-containing protein n=1 Tax=Enterococcus sp. AZ194 TaxID=2774629 RepID=UPI003F215F98
MKKICFGGALLLFVLLMSQPSLAAQEITQPQISIIGNSSADKLTMASPPAFHFGKFEITDSPLVLKAKGDSDLQVIDTRGLGSGWQVQTKISAFESASHNSLTGVAMTLEATAVKATDPENQSAPPKTTRIQLNESSQTIFLADKMAGLGGWQADFSSKESLQLVIPSGNRPGNYSATFTWELVDVPQ